MEAAVPCCLRPSNRTWMPPQAKVRKQREAPTPKTADVQAACFRLSDYGSFQKPPEKPQVIGVAPRGGLVNCFKPELAHSCSSILGAWAFLASAERQPLTGARSGIGCKLERLRYGMTAGVAVLQSLGEAVVLWIFCGRGFRHHGMSPGVRGWGGLRKCGDPTKGDLT